MHKHIIETQTYKSSDQSISFREIYSLDNKKIKIEIKSDSYHKQCFARAYIFKDDKWNLVYSIPYSIMKTPEGLIYRNNYKNKPLEAVDNFAEDSKKLYHYVCQIVK